jgi:hypothetical protein
MVYERNESIEKKKMKMTMITWFMSKGLDFNFASDNIYHK